MDWSLSFEKRYEIHKIYPSIWDIPIYRKRHTLVKSHMKAGCRILDVGADKRLWIEKLEGMDYSYSSMDVNRSQKHDYYDLDEINETFDLILLFEVIEHIPLLEGKKMLETLNKKLSPNGKIIISTPNIWVPTHYFRDATHVQPYAYDELGGLLSHCDFEILDIWRIWNSHWLDRLTRLTFGKLLHRYIGIDFAKTIIIVAGKK
jgi:hypothetical protein